MPKHRVIFVMRFHITHRCYLSAIAMLIIVILRSRKHVIGIHLSFVLHLHDEYDTIVTQSWTFEPNSTIHLQLSGTSYIPLAERCVGEDSEWERLIYVKHGCVCFHGYLSPLEPLKRQAEKTLHHLRPWIVVVVIDGDGDGGNRHHHYRHRHPSHD